MLAHIKSLARAYFNADAYDGFQAERAVFKSQPVAKISPRARPHFATNANRDTERTKTDDRQKRRLIRAKGATYTCV